MDMHHTQRLRYIFQESTPSIFKARLFCTIITLFILWHVTLYSFHTIIIMSLCYCCHELLCNASLCFVERSNIVEIGYKAMQSKLLVSRPRPCVLFMPVLTFDIEQISR